MSAGKLQISSQAHRRKRQSRIGTEPLILASLTFILATACLNWTAHRRHRPSARSASSLPENKDHQHATIPSGALSLPTYTEESAARAVRAASWTCGDRSGVDPSDDTRPFFAFVHVYKTAGSTLRQFFARYADLCRKSTMVIVSCSGVKHSLLSKADENWNDCRLKAVVDARRRILEQDNIDVEERIYPTVNATVLRRHFDILAGHYRFGVTDGVFPQHRQTSSNDEGAPLHVPVRHIVFLRQPMDRFVSSILYRAKQFSMNKKETVEETAEYIKKRISGSRKNDEYCTSIFHYLLTPEQSQRKEKFPHREQLVQHNTQLAIQNLLNYNAIVGMTERFPESMTILRHVLLPDSFTSEERRDWVEEMFDEYTAGGDERSSENEGRITSTRQNPSQMGAISTTSVMAELKKDASFMLKFEEYLKYEQIIVDFASHMHHMQYSRATEATKSNTQ